MRQRSDIFALGLILVPLALLGAEPQENSRTEPYAQTFSMEKGIEFLEVAAADWTQTRKCFTCHTNYAYLIVRPHLSALSTSHEAIRSELEELVEVRWEKRGPRWDAEVVMSAAVLALNDAATTGDLHPATRTALDRMWTVQTESGGINWLKCGWPPMESDDDFGVAMMAIAVGAAPKNYRDSKAAQAGLHKIREYLKSNPPPTLHHSAMLLWADSELGDLLTNQEREQISSLLLKKQKGDGGWNLASLGNWTRADGKPQETFTSDGYATGFVIYALRRSGMSARHPALQRGVKWLKSYQRESGRWYTRSLNKDSKHYISHAGTAFALIAIHLCEDPSQ